MKWKEEATGQELLDKTIECSKQTRRYGYDEIEI